MSSPELQKTADGTGTIVVTREAHSFSDRVRAYKVVIDGEVVGKVRNGKSASFTVAPGQHRVRMKIDWSGSPELVVPVHAGYSTGLICKPAVKPAVAVFKSVEAVGNNENWIELRFA